MPWKNYVESILAEGPGLNHSPGTAALHAGASRWAAVPPKDGAGSGDRRNILTKSKDCLERN